MNSLDAVMRLELFGLKQLDYIQAAQGQTVHNDRWLYKSSLNPYQVSSYFTKKLGNNRF